MCYHISLVHVGRKQYLPMKMASHGSCLWQNLFLTWFFLPKHLAFGTPPILLLLYRIYIIILLLWLNIFLFGHSLYYYSNVCLLFDHKPQSKHFFGGRLPMHNHHSTMANVKKSNGRLSISFYQLIIMLFNLVRRNVLHLIYSWFFFSLQTVDVNQFIF